MLVNLVGKTHYVKPELRAAVQHGSKRTPARSWASVEKAEATGATMATVHEASVSQAATVFFASALNASTPWWWLF